MVDEELVYKAKQGDKEALLNLLLAKQNDYYRLALMQTGSPDDARDAIQDMTVIIFNKIRQLKQAQSFYPWSMTILVNCCRRIYRQRHKTIPLDDNREIVEKLPDNLEQHLDIITALDKLNQGTREAIRLKYLMDMDYDTVAAVLEIPVGTAKSRVFNGLCQLRALVGGNDDE